MPDAICLCPRVDEGVETVLQAISCGDTQGQHQLHRARGVLPLFSTKTNELFDGKEVAGF